MGVKQFCSVCLILLANIMLQVHAFVPHHHHYGQVCFDGYPVNSTIQNDGNDARNNPAHPTDEDAGCCALKHDCLIPDDGFDYKPAVSIVHHGFHLANDLTTVGETILPLRISASIKLFCRSYNKLQSSTYIIISGLRSPPANNLF